jgi:hypothetical protein
MTACVAPAAGCAERTYNAHYVNIAWGCLFSGASGTVVVVGVQRLFAFSVGAALRHRRNEDGYVQLVRWLAKSVTEINNRRDGVWKGKKDRASTGVQ